MQTIVFDKPYKFVPAYRGRWWPRLMVQITDRYMRGSYGVERCECRGTDRMIESLDAGHGILVASNHSRPCDPMACGWLARTVRQPMYCMGSWNVFMGSKIERFFVRRCGAFSIYREGSDPTSLNFAIDSLAKPDRPVIIFPEGSVSRSNDRVQPMLEGTELIARRAAKRRAKNSVPGKVVVHPVAMTYFFRGDLKESLMPVLARIEKRIGWQSRPDQPLLARIRRLGNGLLCLRELEYFGEPQMDGRAAPKIHERIAKLTETILAPLEEVYGGLPSRGTGTYPRVQHLRSRILPDLVAGILSEETRSKRWRHLSDCYVAQQLGCYPKDYLGDDPSPERILETVERLEEDLTDTATIHRPWHLVIQVGSAIEVAAQRRRGGETLPLMQEIRSAVQALVDDTRANPPACLE